MSGSEKLISVLFVEVENLLGVVMLFVLLDEVPNCDVLLGGLNLHFLDLGKDLAHALEQRHWAEVDEALLSLGSFSCNSIAHEAYFKVLGFLQVALEPELFE